MGCYLLVVPEALFLGLLVSTVREKKMCKDRICLLAYLVSVIGNLIPIPAVMLLIIFYGSSLILLKEPEPRVRKAPVCVSSGPSRTNGSGFSSKDR